MKPCELIDAKEWKIDRRGRIWSIKEPGRCLSLSTWNIQENTPLSLEDAPCWRSIWLLNSEGQIRYGVSPFILGFDRSGMNKMAARLIHLSNASDESKWVFDFEVN